MFICKQCDKSFSTKKALALHADTCGQKDDVLSQISTITDVSSRSARSEISVPRNTIEKILKDREKYKKNISSLKEQKIANKDEILEYQTTIQTLNNEKKSLVVNIQKLKTELAKEKENNKKLKDAKSPETSVAQENALNKTLQDKIDSLTSEKSLLQDRINQNEEYQQEQDNEITLLKASITKLNSEIVKQKEEYIAKLHTTQKSYEESEKRINNSHEYALQQVHMDISNIQREKKNLEKRIAEIEKYHKTEIERINTEKDKIIANLSKELEFTKNTNIQTVAKLRMDEEIKIKKIEEKYKQDIEKYDSKHNVTIDNMKKLYEENISNVKHLCETTIKDLTYKHNSLLNEKDNVIKRLDTGLSEKDKEISELRKKLELATLKQESLHGQPTIVNEVESLKNNKMTLETQINQYKLIILKLQDENSNLKSESDINLNYKKDNELLINNYEKTIASIEKQLDIVKTENRQIVLNHANEISEIKAEYIKYKTNTDWDIKRIASLEEEKKSFENNLQMLGKKINEMTIMLENQKKEHIRDLHDHQVLSNELRSTIEKFELQKSLDMHISIKDYEIREMELANTHQKEISKIKEEASSKYNILYETYTAITNTLKNEQENNQRELAKLKTTLEAKHATELDNIHKDYNSKKTTCDAKIQQLETEIRQTKSQATAAINLNIEKYENAIKGYEENLLKARNEIAIHREANNNLTNRLKILQEHFDKQIKINKEYDEAVFTIQKLKKTVEDGEIEITKLNTYISKMTADFTKKGIIQEQEYTSTLSKYTAMINDKDSEIDRLKQKSGIFWNEVEHMRADIINKNNKILELEARVSDFDIKLTDYEVRKDIANESTKQLYQVKDQYFNITKKLKTELDEIKQKNITLMNKLNEKDDKYKKAMIDITAYQSQIEQLIGEKIDKTNTITLLEKKLKDFKDELNVEHFQTINTLKEEYFANIKRMKKDLEDANTRISFIVNDNTDKEILINALTNDKLTLSSRLETQEAILSEKKIKISELESIVANLNSIKPSHITEHKEQLRTIKNECLESIKAVKSEVNTLKKENEILRQLLEGNPIVIEYAEKNDTIQRLENEIKILKIDLEEARTNVARDVSQHLELIETLTETIKEKESHIVFLEKRISSLVNK